MNFLADDFSDEEETDDKSNDFHGSESNSLALKSCNDFEGQNNSMDAFSSVQTKSSESFNTLDSKVSRKLIIDSDVRGWRLVI